MLELLLLGGAAVGCYKLAQAAKTMGVRLRHRWAAQAAYRQMTADERRRFAQADALKRLAARDMQLAIQQLAQSPDFRRAATFAARAAQVGVPAAFRLRQFRRLRSLLIEHLVRRLQVGAALETAAEGLRELVGSLGVAAYEADYIAAEAQGRGQAHATRTTDYRDHLRQSHAEHRRRLQAIEGTPDLEEELREQLLEAEHERFRGELMEEPDQGN